MSSVARLFLVLAALAVPMAAHAEITRTTFSAFDFTVVRPAPGTMGKAGVLRRWLRLVSGRRPEDTTLQIYKFRLGTRWRLPSPGEESASQNGLLAGGTNLTTRMFRLKLRW